MRQVREVLRLKHVCGHSGHQIAAMVGVSRYTVAEYLRRAGVVGITWPVPPELDDAALERKLFTPPFAPADVLRPQPAWACIHAELRRPGVTLLLVWEEYRAGQPEGCGYSRFCSLYAAWRGRLSPTMRQLHPAGERLFVDYVGQTVEVIDGATGKVRPAQIFVAAIASTLRHASKGGREEPGSPAQAAVTGGLTEGGATQVRPSHPVARTTPAWAGRAIAPFADVERL